MTDRSFWQERWDEGRIGFHLGTPHPSLLRHIGRLDLRPTSRVLVPLAGKAADLDVLGAQAGHVYANEYIERAAREFFAERGLASVEERGRYLRLTSGTVTFLCEDFFALTPEDIGGPVDAAFDRAALVAIAPAQRPAYAAQLTRLLAPGGKVLLVVFAYDQTRIEGPPFSVPPAEVHSLFREAFSIATLETIHAEVGPKFHEVGIPVVEEHTLLLERK
jgi:thiopurine S-methyltransferase